MTSLSNLRYGCAWIDKLFAMKNQELKALGTKYQVLRNLGILLQGARGIQSYKFLRMRTSCY